MATTKKRVNISVSKQVEEALEKLAKRDQVPQATKAGELLRMAIELEEDEVWDAIATARLRTDKRRIAHKDAWK